ncbi:MAG TPA: alginate export family protein [Prosthecobacter sp.]
MKNELPALLCLLGLGLSWLAGTVSAAEEAETAQAVTDPWDRVPPRSDSSGLQTWGSPEFAGWTMRMSGHARTMAEAYRNPDFGFSEVDEDAWIHHRIQAFMQLDHGREATLAAELTWGEMQGKQGSLAPVDEDRVDLLQLYLQLRWELGDAEVVMRAGRQVLYYGSGRLLAHREGANQRLSHDALRLSWRQNGWQVDVLAGSPVKVLPQEFDNSSYFHQTRLWGVYATGPSPFGKGHGVDLYYLGLYQENNPLLVAGGGGSEHRHTFGTRWFGNPPRWQYNHEFILQTGRSSDRDIWAGAVSLGAGRIFKEVMFEPLLGFKGDMITGGQGSGTVHTFNPLFQANNYFNEGGFVSPSNLWNLNPYLSFKLAPTVALTLGVNFLWRFDPDDAVYGPPFNELAGAAPNGERYLGTAYNLSLGWDPHPALSFSLGLTHHEAGPSLAAVGGQSVDYLQIAARLEF